MKYNPMQIQIYSLTSCTAQKRWGSEPEKVVCYNGLLLLFDRECGDDVGGGSDG